MIARRSFLTGLASLTAAPAIVHADALMKITGVVQPWPRDHRWLGAYCIETDEVILRADTLYGDYDALRNRSLGAGFHAPPTPEGIYRGGYGVWVPNEQGCRCLDAHHQEPLRRLYESFEVTSPTHFVTQRHVDMAASSNELRNTALWERIGFS